jgi:fructose-bisphosphate aldolase class II
MPSELAMSVSEEMGMPCTDDCMIKGYPNLPASVHPGVVTGKALIDLLT